jgi:hypothetical protein
MKLRSIRVKQLQPETNRIQVQGKVPKIYNFDPDVVHNRGRTIISSDIAYERTSREHHTCGTTKYSTERPTKIMSTKNKFRTATETPYEYFDDRYDPVIFGCDEIYNLSSFKMGFRS